MRGLAVSERGWIAVSVDGTDNNASAESSIRVVDPRSGETVASLDRPDVRLGQVAFTGGTRIAVSDSSGRLLLADALEGRWLDAPDPGALGFARYELVAHPIATRGDAVAHVGPDGNVLVSTLPATKPEAGEPFLLELEPQAAGDARHRGARDPCAWRRVRGSPGGEALLLRRHVQEGEQGAP